MQQGPFLGAVQIIVYTGAIMILFLFVLMLVGRESSDSVVETLRGQRQAATVAGIAFAALVGAGVGRAVYDAPVEGLASADERRRQRRGDRQAAVHRLPVRLRADQRAAHHRRRRRDDPGARGEGAGRAAYPA
ncbi:MAG: NADH-quinone oxidoreductase subunit J [Geodermatophilaceae bacterium]